MNVRNLPLQVVVLTASIFAVNQSFAETPALKPANNTPGAASAPTAVPSLVPFSGTAAAGGKALNRDATVTFQIFKDEAGGESLWTETQVVTLDATGRYQVQLGAANLNGLPADLFATGEARWLEVQVASEAPSPRVLISSVPYALKASDAATLGGLPASAFMLAGSKTGTAAAAPLIAPEGPNSVTNVTTTGGTSGYLPQFTGASTVVDSILYNNGTQLGIGTTVPTATLTVDGTLAVSQSSTYNGFLLLNPTGTATSTKAFDSQLLKLYASAYSSTSHSAITPHFEWQVEPTGNNTSTTGATLNLLATPNTSGAVETGLYFNTNGTIHFASGQTFPGGGGSGGGTITGVTAGSDLTGGGTTGTVTLNLDTTKVPTLAGNNTFAGSETFNGTSTFNQAVTANAATSIFTPSVGLGVYTTQNGSIYAQLEVPTSNNQYGWAIEGSAANAYAGVFGYGDNKSQAGVIASGNIGLYGYSDLYASNGLSGPNASRLTAAVYAQAGSISKEGSYTVSQPAALFADGGISAGSSTGSNQPQVAVSGTTDDNVAAEFTNNSDSGTLALTNDGSGDLFDGFTGNNGRCRIDGSADLICSGFLAGSNVTADQRTLRTYGIQAAENWYEDYGSGQLQGGSATVNLDHDFAQTVNTTVDYHVFLTPKGDCKGLYVTNESANGFEVRELGGGATSIAFDYKIVAKRRGFEQVRLTDVSADARRDAELRLKRNNARARVAGHPSVPPVPQRANLEALKRR